MRKYVISLLALALMAASANAVTAAEWKGFYVGGAVGGLQHTADWTDLDYDWNGQTLSLPQYGSMFGVVAGWNWQPDTLVYGVEVNLNVASAESVNCYDDGCGSEVTITDEVKALHTLKGRVGLPVGKALFSLSAGVATGKVEHSWIEFGDAPDSWETFENTNFGQTFGVGLDHRFSDLMSLRIEYTKSFIAGEGEDNRKGEHSMKVDEDIEAVLVGLNFAL